MPVRVYSNLDEVELFLNGQSQGSQKVPRLGHVQWMVKYQPGVIEARGSTAGAVVLIEMRETTGPAIAIRLTADRMEIDADGEDLAILTVSAIFVQRTGSGDLTVNQAGRGDLRRGGERERGCP